MNRILLIAVFVPILFVSESAIGDAPSPLAQKYINLFSGSPSEESQLHALNQLQWSGLSDVRLFDLLEQKVLEIYPEAKGEEAELASWYAKVLGTSGQEKYRSTLQSIAESAANSKVRKYANEGLNNLTLYAQWNPIISSTEGVDPDKPQQTNAFVNMLRSDRWELRNMAAKRIYADSVFDPYLLDVLQTTLMSEYDKDYGVRYQDQTVAWMAKALAASRQPAYRASLEEVASNGANSKLRSYAKKYLKQYY